MEFRWTPRRDRRLLFHGLMGILAKARDGYFHRLRNTNMWSFRAVTYIKGGNMRNRTDCGIHTTAYPYRKNLLHDSRCSDKNRTRAKVE